MVLLGVVLLAARQRAVLGGTQHWLFGPDHFLALILIGMWAGRRMTRAPWAAPSGLLAGSVLGLLLGSLLDPVGHHSPVHHPLYLLMLVSTVVALAAALLVYSYSPFNIARALLIVGIAHGYVDSSHIGAADPAIFLIGYAASAALLLVLGVLVGREFPRGR